MKKWIVEVTREDGISFGVQVNSLHDALYVSSHGEMIDIASTSMRGPLQASVVVELKVRRNPDYKFIEDDPASTFYP